MPDAESATPVSDQIAALRQAPVGQTCRLGRDILSHIVWRELNKSGLDTDLPLDADQ
jgi:hypothetical protein